MQRIRQNPNAWPNSITPRHHMTTPTLLVRMNILAMDGTGHPLLLLQRRPNHLALLNVCLICLSLMLPIVLVLCLVILQILTTFHPFHLLFHLSTVRVQLFVVCLIVILLSVMCVNLFVLVLHVLLVLYPNTFLHRMYRVSLVFSSSSNV